MNISKITFIVYLLLLTGGVQLSSQSILFVNQNAQGNNNGSSWTNAFTNLQDAIQQADSSTLIWVAEGEYFPTISNIRTISFVLKNGVKMYGGFEGTETNLSERDYINHPTILSGDVGIQGDSTDNSYHVVYAIGTDSTACLDGFIIRDGYAVTGINNSDYNSGAGLKVATDEIHSNASPVIINNQFINNKAQQAGGAIYCEESDNYIAAPSIKNCTFINNSAHFGGAIFKGGNSFPLNPFVIDSCAFEENSAVGGGAIAFYKIEGKHIVKNCSFARDSSPYEGGAILYKTFNKTGQLDIINTHFSDVTGGLGVLVFYINNSSITPLTYNINIIDCSFHGENFINPNLHSGIRLHLNSNQTGNTVFIKLKNTTFEDLRTTTSTGAFRISSNYSTTTTIHANVTDCYFKGKSPIPSGTHQYYNAFNIHNLGVNDSFFLNVNNTIFDGSNRAFVSASPNGNDASSTIQANFNNCTFYNNGKSLFSKYWSPDVNYDHQINVSNSIIWTESPIDSIFHNHNNTTDSITFEGYSVDHCLINTPDCLVNGIDVCGEGMLYQVDPLFVDSMNSDFRLRACSPAINIGDNNFIDTLLIPYDYRGQLRILEDIVDLGAFEQNSSPTITPLIQGASDAGTADGSIIIDTVYGGTPPYQFIWDTGETGNTLVNLSTGVYTVTITDSIGCELIQSVEVGLFTNLKELDYSDPRVLIFPNPATGQVRIDIESSHVLESNKIELYDARGCLLLRQEGGSTQRLNLSPFPSGVYFILIAFPDGDTVSKRLLLQH